MDPFPPPSMTLSPQSPPVPPPSNVNVFRPRRSDDWHEYREIIEQLYRIDQLKLRDVKRIMERDYKFFASEKQYKDRLAAWHVRKNIKAKEVHLMLRKQQKRAARGKQTAFRVGGQDVDPKRIARFVRRYGSAWEQDKDKAERPSPEPTTPSDMTCYTPEPAEEAATPISPQDMQSPSREPSAYPLNYDPTRLESIPDFIIGEEHPVPMTLHSNPPPRPTYHHPTEPIAHPVVHSVTHPGSATVPGQLHPQQQNDLDAPGEIVPHSDDWNRLDTFQTRLEGLQYTLNRTMSKWARDQDPNQEISHHEGLGM